MDVEQFKQMLSNINDEEREEYFKNLTMAKLQDESMMEYKNVGFKYRSKTTNLNIDHNILIF